MCLCHARSVGDHLKPFAFNCFWFVYWLSYKDYLQAICFSIFENSNAIDNLIDWFIYLLIFQLGNTLFDQSQTCASRFSGGAIYVDGSFKYCHVQFENNDPSAYTIFNDDLDLVDMIAQGEHHEDEKSEDCKKCRYRSVCTSCCPVYRVDGKDPQCSLYHRFIPKYYELQAIERLQLLQIK